VWERGGDAQSGSVGQARCCTKQVRTHSYASETSPGAIFTLIVPLCWGTEKLYVDRPSLGQPPARPRHHTTTPSTINHQRTSLPHHTITLLCAAHMTCPPTHLTLPPLSMQSTPQDEQTSSWSHSDRARDQCIIFATCLRCSAFQHVTGVRNRPCLLRVR
jgi:hypothetical protein